MAQQRTLMNSALIVLAAGAIGGCAQLAPDTDHWREAGEQVSRVDRHSSFPSVRRVFFEQVNLVELVDPHGGAKSAYPAAWEAAEGLSDERKWGVQYDLVFNWFRSSKETSDEDKRVHRNSVQDRILAVATSRCNVFKTFLRRQQSDMNFALGTATTAAGVLGAVLPGVRASRNLAGIAGFFSGAQAEYNNAYYSNLTAHVIVQGIEIRQAKLQKELIEGRQGKSVADYSIEAAISDAIFIDGSCSTVNGLLEAADSIKEVSNPGLARAAEVIAGVRAANEIALADKVSDLAESGKLAKLLKQATASTSPLVVSMVKTDPNPIITTESALAEASRAAARASSAIDSIADRVVARFNSSQAKLAKNDQSTDLDAAKLREYFVNMAKLSVQRLEPALGRCTTALKGPASALGAAAAVAQLQNLDKSNRIEADQNLAKAKADVAAALQRVEALLEASTQTVNAGADAWQAEFAKSKLTKQQLTNTAFPTVPDSLTRLCA